MRVAQEARFVRDVTREIAPAWRRQRRLFTVVPLSPNEGTLEGWVMPVSAQGGRTAVLGGDVALVRAANGSLRRIVDRSATWTLITIPATGPVQLRSAERDVAAVSDLALARSVAERGREVTVTTSAAKSALVQGLDTNGSRFRWEHTRAPRSAPEARRP